MSRTTNCERCGTVRWDNQDECNICDSLEVQNFREALVIVKNLNPQSIQDQLNLARLEQIFENAIEHFEENLDRLHNANEIHSNDEAVNF